MKLAASDLLLALVVAALLIGCTPETTPTYFLPPTPNAAAAPPPAPPESVPTASLPPESQDLETSAVPSPTPPCTDDLGYLQDLTIPDQTVVSPGQIIDKRWQVVNSGTCNWDQRYQLRLVSGDPMGAITSMRLYPARAGAQATIRIIFTAPSAAGTYECQWQAVNPDGVPFGDAFYMQIVVAA